MVAHGFSIPLYRDRKKHLAPGQGQGRRDRRGGHRDRKRGPAATVVYSPSRPPTCHDPLAPVEVGSSLWWWVSRWASRHAAPHAVVRHAVVASSFGMRFQDRGIPDGCPHPPRHQRRAGRDAGGRCAGRSDALSWMRWAAFGPGSTWLARPPARRGAGAETAPGTHAHPAHPHRRLSPSRPSRRFSSQSAQPARGKQPSATNQEQISDDGRVRLHVRGVIIFGRGGPHLGHMQGKAQRTSGPGMVCRRATPAGP